MASIVSSLSTKAEIELRKLFPSRVCFHLLYKSSHHGASVAQLLDRFDNHGKYLLTIFLQSGSVRGTFMSKPLDYGKEDSDEEMFVFKIERYGGSWFRGSKCNISATDISLSVDSVSISFGKGLNLKVDKGCWYESFCSDVINCKRGQQEENVLCMDVELHRVQDDGDILPSPWREVSWCDNSRESLRKDFVSYKPFMESLTRVKALLLGPVGSGKSSFINSVRSTMYQRIVHLPNIGTSVEGFTKKMTTYNIRVNQRGSQSALSLCDMMAIGDDDTCGISYTDVLAAIKGHIPERYQFQRGVPVSDKVSGYIENPTLNEQVHCVLFVLDASKVPTYPSSLESTLRKLHATISDLGIPQLILLTHMDQVCPSVLKDLKDVYSSHTVQNIMQKAGELVGLPLSYVLPVKNYISQLTMDYTTDILLLTAVMSILQAVDDTFEDQYPVPVPNTPVDVMIYTPKEVALQ